MHVIIIHQCTATLLFTIVLQKPAAIVTQKDMLHAHFNRRIYACSLPSGRVRQDICLQEGAAS